MSNQRFRHLVKWLGLVLLAHFVVMIVYNIFLKSYVAAVAAQNQGEAKMTMLFFSVIVPPIILAIKEKITSSMVEYRRVLKLAMKEEGFSLIKYFKENFLTEMLWETGVYGLVQLPFILFIMIPNPLVIMLFMSMQPFYMLEYGFYVTTMFTAGGIPILFIGWILATLYFALVYIAIKLLFLALSKRSIETI